jgi:hypothetical protein
MWKFTMYDGQSGGWQTAVIAKASCLGQCLRMLEHKQVGILTIYCFTYENIEKRINYYSIVTLYSQAIFTLHIINTIYDVKKYWYGFLAHQAKCCMSFCYHCRLSPSRLSVIHCKLSVAFNKSRSWKINKVYMS